MNNTILVVEDDAGLREALIDTLEMSGIDCVAADSAEQAMVLLKKDSFSLVVSDVQMGAMSGLDLLRSINLNYPDLPVLMMTAYATIDDAVEAMRLGAIDYMAKPFAPEVLLNMVSRYLPEPEKETDGPIVADPSSIQLLELASRVAKSDASVMVLGPSGSGKEVLARFIHDKSDRAEQPFVAINCAAIPENMLEATLFGYEKGAFTGAIQACPGKFEQAQGGTILLDEITEMDLGLQAKLLRVLQEREVERLGGRKTIKLDVRILATSNRDLKEAVAKHQFREDLYYRLNVFPLMWRPLCQRPGDIVVLAKHLIERHLNKSKEPIAVLSEPAEKKLLAHTWPGNVRELDNVIQRALILRHGDMIDESAIFIENLTQTPLTAALSASLVPANSAPESTTSAVTSSPTNDAYYDLQAPAIKATAQRNQLREELPSLDSGSYKDELKDKEHRIILETLNRCQGKRKDVAETLGISPRTLRYKLAQMRDLGITLPA
ncbi:MULTISPECIES: sigma-54 dependent transcriptional regulator [Pseudoalteromonas]|jgi:two-component system response regulator FlrC|uniref:sigma-54-dependent transcriptional regulator n=1 Tax=Pseudoalteromonas TaxID=53246 RepID=UPI001601C0B3|nr:MULTISPECIES: sigma-54 dependent transcriptional regulator [Pseudoalteromonas]MBB1293585.1 sigma-54-dependent Fis family transcriptional regulator [Pseudoalteromonas sp. SR41-4]MBB1300501.1 sigma-54-dependent Fis family transcriptional regulator [Pseudoalteromonas sp. SR44-8]MBB1309567.1 sigma-54-dependent Fis family transcriptional regulator [Pseudoalteromonas sp. SR41-8]MBB1504934.1 sigma-54-dependent Fis family transcriptional regulator [Pseudoalteromonas sp. SG41-1]|tara:strand:- start:10293 stop:11771 length:1479 start_codon:yes stop_codon:yes gene_type:complete